MAASAGGSAFSPVGSADSTEQSATSRFRSELREKAKKRRQLLAKQLGVANPKSLSNVLGGGPADQVETEALNRLDNSLTYNVEPPPKKKTEVESEAIDTSKGIEWHAPQNTEKDLDEITEEEIYTDSSAFLKGTQSDNPHNDYCQHFVDSGERPQNFIHDLGLENRFEEYPKLRELIRLKDELIQQTATPPMYLKCDLETYDLRDVNCKFDVILVEPPLEEYQRSVGLNREKYWSWDEIEALEIEKIAAPRSFLWIWCGSSDGLDAGRRCLKKWGFRRCEDVCWIKTNINNPQKKKNVEPRSIFQRTKEHCLMGIKGTVRRSTDGDFIHANVDIDLIIHEEMPWGSAEKPVEIFHIIEHFCLGRRRLHIFGKDTTIRPGWLTVGPDLTSSNFDPEQFGSYFNTDPDAYLTGCTDEIERLRPKSPPPKVRKDDGSQSGRGGGRGRGGGGGPGRGSINSGGRGGGGPPRGRGGTGMHQGPPRGGGWRGRGGGGYGGGRGR